MQNSSSSLRNWEHTNNHIRSLLPPIPHSIESSSYTDALHWECVLSVALLSESDCMKWLKDFTEISKTRWRINDNTPPSNVLNKKVLWGMVYSCETNAEKGCPAKLECKILSPSTETNDLKIKSKAPLPCLISIHFHHNHPLSNPKAMNPGLEASYFLAPRTGQANAPRLLILNQGNPIIPSQEQLGVVFDIEDVNKKLDEQLAVLKTLLKQSGTGCAAVKQFTDQFDRIKNDADTLENALINFGTTSVNSGEIISMGGNPHPVAWTTGSILTGDNTSPGEDLFAKSANLVLTNNNNNNNNNTILHNGLFEEDEESLKKKVLGKKKKHDAVSPGQIDPLTGKRKKRSRCGVCSGCINRDKTQDCRECRNCLDQKRYGGPGRLKKACIKRSCVVMCTADTNASSSSSAAQQAQISLPSSSLGIPVGTAGSNSVIASSSVTLGHQGSVLSWPAGTQFAPTFQVQQPVQFTYQPQGFEEGVVASGGSIAASPPSNSSPTVTYTTQSIKLEPLASGVNGVMSSDGVGKEEIA